MFFAVFLTREKTRRHSFSQPIRHSTMLRLRYASRSNPTGQASRSSFAFDGITGVMPNSDSNSSIQSARYPLSPAKAMGHATGPPCSIDDPLIRAVDAPQLTVGLARVDAGPPQAGGDRVQDPVGVPGVEDVPDGAPRAEVLGQVAPRHPGPEDPEDAVDDLASISRWSARASPGREE